MKEYNHKYTSLINHYLLCRYIKWFLKKRLLQEIIKLTTISVYQVRILTSSISIQTWADLISFTLVLEFIDSYLIWTCILQIQIINQLPLFVTLWLRWTLQLWEIYILSCDPLFVLVKQRNIIHPYHWYPITHN